MSESLFWADQLAREIKTRKKFHYTADAIPKMGKYVVKTSASLSGVLHIGRLSDTIRSESVARALSDLGLKSEFIWVAEDMDPLRKVPKGVPKSYEKYIGTPVTDIPDPEGCHKSYAEHHLSKYFEVIDKFVSMDMKKYSMREEYKLGHFADQIRKIIGSMDMIRQIQNKYRREPLAADWSPWTPICDNCGKIITTKVRKIENGLVHYVCRDYKFEQTTAKGCGHQGENDPMKFNGKLLWKGEWAAQWARWKVVSEGAGKEYQVPGSAFWVNGEIVEKVLGFPMPVPIFYEHLIIDNRKMSASLGNVVYPDDWLDAATPELLRFFYNKKLMKTRSFSWKDLPKVYDDYDLHERVYFGKESLENKKEEEHMKRLYEMAQTEKPKRMPIQLPFDFAVMISQMVPPDRLLEDGLEILKKTGHLKKEPEIKELGRIQRRLALARHWAERHAPEQYRFEIQDDVSERVKSQLSDKQKAAIRYLKEGLELNDYNEEELFHFFFHIAKEKIGLPPADFFKGVYLVLINKEYGPRLSRFILGAGKDEVIRLLEQV